MGAAAQLFDSTNQEVGIPVSAEASEVKMLFKAVRELQEGKLRTERD